MLRGYVTYLCLSEITFNSNMALTFSPLSVQETAPCVNFFINHVAHVKPPSHSDKDHKDRTTFLKRDKRRENWTKCRKKHSFQVCSTSLLRSCQDVTASNKS